MKKILLIAFISGAFFAVSFAGPNRLSNHGSSATISPEQKKHAEDLMQNQPVRFLENRGQMKNTDHQPVPAVLFKASSPGMDMYITKTGLTCVFVKSGEEKEGKEEAENDYAEADEKKMYGEEGEERSTEMAWLNVHLKGASIKPENIVKEGESSEHFNFFYGHCPDGIYGVKEYEKITIREVYPGIDWVFYNADKKGMKYDFVVHAGADPANIKLVYESEKPLTLNEKGIIEIVTPLGTFTEQAPYSYLDGNKDEVPSHYSARPIDAHHVEISFALPTVVLPISSTLIIDPALSWASFYGGTSWDGMMSVTCDNNNNVFVGGYTQSIDLPVMTAGTFYQAAHGAGGGNVINSLIVKFNNAGVRMWATYYGGNGTPGATGGDNLFNITTDPAGNLFAVGITGSSNFPTQFLGGAYFQGALSGVTDGFIIKFTNTGIRQWATRFGGNDYDRIMSVTTDATGNVFVLGNSDSPNLPVLNPGAGAYFQGYAGGAAQSGDAFIAKFSNVGVLQWSTYYGGTQDERAYSIATDGTNVFATGYTNSANFPTQAAFQTAFAGGGGDAFILKFNNNGNRQWATYFGGSGTDKAYATISDAGGNVFVSGPTDSPNFPVLNPGGGAYFQGTNGGGLQDAFVLKLSPAGARLWATYYGGSGDEGFSCFDDMARDGCGNIYMSFNTTGNVPVMACCDGGYYDASYNGGTTDIVILMFSNTGTRLWATYWGGNGSDFREALAVDGNNNLFMCGEWNGVTNSGAYPVVNPGGGAYYDGTFNGPTNTDDGFVAKFRINNLLTSSAVNQPSCSNPCSGDATAIVSPAACTYTYLWSNGQTTQTATGLCAGVYNVSIISALCKTASVTVTINATASFSLTSTKTNATCVTLGSANVNVTSGTGPYTYLWSNGQATQTATGLPAGSYTVTVTDASGCSGTQVVTITQPTSAITVGVSSIPASCTTANGTATASATGGTSAYTYVWNNGQTSPTATGLAAGVYTVTVTDANGCTQTAVANVSNSGSPQANVTSANNLCNGGSTGSATANVTVGQAPYTYAWNPSGQAGATATGLPAGNYAVTVTDAFGCIVIVTTTISEPAAMTSSATSTNTNCGVSTGTASVAAAGGTGAFTYLWNNGQNNATATALAAGTYTVTITDANGCTAVQTVTVNSNNAMNITVSSTVAGCTVNNGTATANASSGNGPYTFSWSDGQATSTATGLGAGTYTATITDANGCIGTETVTVTVNNTLVLAVSSTDAGCTVSNGTATANPGSGPTPYTYLWDNGQVTQTATGLAAGNYSVTVTDANGCSLSLPVSVNSNNTLLLTTSFTQAGCVVANGTATANASSGTPGYSYAWDNGQITPTATGLAAGSYTVTVTDANGCTQVQPVTVTTNNPVIATTSTTQTACTINNGTATANPSNGAVPYTYLWNNGQASATANGLAAGTYTVTITDANGCTQIRTAIVTTTPGPVVAPFASPPTITVGDSSMLSATGTGMYVWSPAAGVSCITCLNPVVSPTITSTYCVRVTDSNGCSDSNCVTVLVQLDCENAGELYIPNAFSPNGDGENDVIQLYYGNIDCLKSIKFIIYNRWGQRVFETEDAAAKWDGTFRGKGSDEGTAVYAYFMQAILLSGEEVIKQGNITLFR